MRYIELAFALGIMGTVASGAALGAECRLSAEQPQYNGAISGLGSWSNCATNAKVTVLLREDVRFWTDKTLVSKSRTGSSGSLSLLRACGNRFDPIKVYVEVRAGNKKVQSPRAILPCK